MGCETYPPVTVKGEAIFPLSASKERPGKGVGETFGVGVGVGEGPAVGDGGGDGGEPRSWATEVIDEPAQAGFCTVKSSRENQSFSFTLTNRGSTTGVTLVQQQQELRTEAAGNTWYVSKKGNGSDGRSWATAWNELDRINWGAVQSGDLILLDGGSDEMVYNSPLSISASGTSDNPITIRLASDAGRNGRAVIDGGVAAGCPAQGSSQPRQFDYGVELGSSQWVVIDGTRWGGIEIRNSREAGVHLGSGQNILIRYTEVHHNGADGWDAGFARQDWQAHHVTISHSEIYRNGNDAIHGTGANYMTLEYNYIHDHYCGHPDGLQATILTANSNVPDDAGRFTNVVIRNNIISDHKNGPHGMGIFLGETGGHESWVDGAVIHDNLIFNIADASIRTKHPKTTNVSVYRNTIVDIGRWAIQWSSGGATAPLSIRDNIFYRAGKTTSLVNVPTKNGQTTFANNCVYQSGSLPSGATGTITQDPQFVDPGNDNYALRSGSPCTGKGSSITSVAQLLGSPPAPPLPSPTPRPSPTPTLTPTPRPSPTHGPSPTPAPSPTPLPGLSFEAESGSISSPFSVSGGYVSQSVETTDPASGGKASYRFNITDPGDYVIKAVVDASSLGSDSFFVNIDGEPVSPEMIWDIGLTNGFEEKVVSWRGSGTPSANEFVPKVFTLTNGEHELVIRGRERDTLLDKITLEKIGSSSCNLLGDVNCDGIVNILDFQILSNNFGTSNPASDLNGDGTVNILDFQILSNNFGRTN